MEGPSKRSKITHTKLEASRVRYYNFKCNAFLDWMLQATKEEQTWAAQTLMCDWKDGKHTWEWDGTDLLMLVSQGEHVNFTFGRDGSAPRVGDDKETHISIQGRFVTRNPWLKRGDYSVYTLTKDALICIFSHFKSPKDLFCVVRVCWGWRNAGTTPALYERRIAALLARSHLEKPPFYDPLFQPHQYYFALSFFSCKSDYNLSEKIINHVRNGNIQLALFIRGLHSGWGHSPLVKGYTVYQEEGEWYLCNSSRLPRLLVSERGIMDGSKIVFTLWCGTSFDHPVWRPDFK